MSGEEGYRVSYATDFDGGCLVLHDADCCQCIWTVKPCSQPNSIGCVTQ
jgi:hypothetical protein